MTAYARRIVIPETPPDLRRMEDRRDEELRLAQFRYSETVLAGQRCDFRSVENNQ
jgi:hypothetical protein